MRKQFVATVIAISVLILTACGTIRKTVDLEYGKTYKIENEKITEKENVVFESEDSTIAKVTNGIVTACAPGTVNIDIKENNKVIGIYTFNITTVPITNIMLSSNSMDLKVGEGATLNFTPTPQNASRYGITWTSANPSVVSVDSNGHVLAKQSGSTTIMVSTVDGISDKCVVTVAEPTAYEQLTDDERTFVDDIYGVIYNYKNPYSVKFLKVDGVADSHIWRYITTAENSFGADVMQSYHYIKGLLIEGDSTGLGYDDDMNAALITQAMQEKVQGIC